MMWFGVSLLPPPLLRGQILDRRPLGLPPPRLGGGQLANPALDDRALPRRAVDQRDAEHRIPVAGVGHVVAQARVIPAVLEYVAGDDVPRLIDGLWHVYLRRRTIRSPAAAAR